MFYAASGLALLGAVSVISASKPTRALLSLIASMFGLSTLYLILGADFVAMANLIVYAGAVLVLFLFVIMLQGTGAREVPFLKRFSVFYLAAALLLSAGFLILILKPVLSLSLSGAAAGSGGSTKAVGHALFTDYLLPFELTSLLLLLGILAGVALAKREESR